jgi:chromosome segregation ATPase
MAEQEKLDQNQDLQNKDELDRGDVLREEGEDQREKAKLELDDIDKEVEKEELEARQKKQERDNEERIPKSRFNKAMENARKREEELQARLQDLERRIPREEKVDELKALRTQREELSDSYEELLLDGKKDEAKKVRRQIRDIEDRLDEVKASRASQDAQQQALKSLRYDTALATVERQYAELNPDTDDYDEDVALEVHDLMKGMAASGLDPDVALKKAVRYVLGAPKEHNKEKADEVTKQRAKGEREKNADAMKKQPADTGKVGLDSDKAGKETLGVDVAKLTYNQFAKLDEEMKAKLRGDTV